MFDFGKQQVVWCITQTVSDYFSNVKISHNSLNYEHIVFH